MTVKVLIPTPLQKFTNDEASVSLEAGSVDELLLAMETRYPGIRARLCDEKGTLRRFLNVYVNSEDIRFLNDQQPQSTPLQDGDQVSIVPAVAGG
ncbi:MAG: MoaD/ThiS family protein [Nodosilinea sp. LVE1205-7]|jgi:molybdopterin converting factor small subunit